jgi:hypothetical protein
MRQAFKLVLEPGARDFVARETLLGQTIRAVPPSSCLNRGRSMVLGDGRVTVEDLAQFRRELIRPIGFADLLDSGIEPPAQHRVVQIAGCEQNL